MKNQTVYLLPGRNDPFDDPPGNMIARMGYTICGREILADFARLRFSEQVELVKADLQAAFWHAAAIVIARSYGAYLLLHSLAEMEPFVGRILLFSPVLGSAITREGLYGSIPPRAQKLAQLVQNKSFPSPQYMEIHTGVEDHGCDPRLAERFCDGIAHVRLYLVPGASHTLEQSYMQAVLDRFLEHKPSRM